jgi:hypothetical protein
MFAITDGDVPGHAFAEAESREQPEGCRQPLLAIPALCGWIVECGHNGWAKIAHDGQPGYSRSEHDGSG